MTQKTFDGRVKSSVFLAGCKNYMKILNKKFRIHEVFLFIHVGVSEFLCCYTWDIPLMESVNFYVVLLGTFPPRGQRISLLLYLGQSIDGVSEFLCCYTLDILLMESVYFSAVLPGTFPR